MFPLQLIPIYNVRMSARRLAFLILLTLPAWLTASAQNLPEEAYVCCIDGHPQTYELSCEARSAVDWAGYFGVTIAEYDFMQALPASDNPEMGFVGEWRGVWGSIPPNAYGVHPPPVAKTLREFGVQAQAADNLTWDDLRQEIAVGRPVIVWVIAQMWAGTSLDYRSQDGAIVTVAPFEHTMILTGYSPTTVEVVDALTGRTLTFPLADFLESWSVLGRRAVLMGRSDLVNTPLPTASASPTPSPTLTPTPIPTATLLPFVTVRSGDTLVGIAAAQGVTWQSLTARNGLTYPYFIYPGDVFYFP